MAATFDGCCADYVGACAVLIKQERGLNIWPDIQTGNVTEEVEELLTKYQYTRELYDWLNPFPYAASTLHKIADNYADIIYITARPLSTKDITNKWLELHGFPSARVINVRGSKIPAVTRERVDIFIEDRLMYAVPLAEEGLKVILLNLYEIDYTECTFPDSIRIVTNWEEVRNVVVEGFWEIE